MSKNPVGQTSGVIVGRGWSFYVIEHEDTGPTMQVVIDKLGYPLDLEVDETAAVALWLALANRDRP